jgi:hypothetical protein
VAAAVGLQPLGKALIHGVSGAQYHNYYMFFVGFPMGQVTQASPGAQNFQGAVHIFNNIIQGSELLLGPQHGFDVLLGMDVIGQGSLAVEGGGTYSFSF